jgi:hypothetical protein
VHSFGPNQQGDLVSSIKFMVKVVKEIAAVVRKVEQITMVARKAADFEQN